MIWLIESVVRITMLNSDIIMIKVTCKLIICLHIGLSDYHIFHKWKCVLVFTIYFIIWLILFHLNSSTLLLCLLKYILLSVFAIIPNIMPKVLMLLFILKLFILKVASDIGQTWLAFFSVNFGPRLLCKYWFFTTENCFCFIFSLRFSGVTNFPHVYVI